MENNKVTHLKTKPNKEIIKTFYESYMNDWSVIPVDPKSKAPTIQSWKQYQFTLPTKDEINEWEKTAEGVALVTGQLSGLVVLDVDMGNEKDGFKHLKDKHLPITPTVKTQNGGYHYYFKHPGIDKKVKTTSGILEHVDFRGDQGYVLIPHTPGYEWVDGLSFEDVEPAELPKWLSDLVVKERGEASIKYSILATPPQDTQNKVKLLGNLTGEKIKNWYRSEDVVRALMNNLNLEGKKIGQSFNCILPGHQEEKPSASFYQADNGTYVYHDFHGVDQEQFLMLPEVYASMHYKKVVTLDKKKGLTDTTISTPEFSVWAIRLLVDLGFISPYEITIKELPKGIKPTIQKVYDGFIKLLGCKWLYSPGEPSPFSWRFAKVWCGVSERKTGEAIRWLIANNYLEITGTERMRGRDVTLLNIKT